MKTKAIRMYGANDLRLEEFELPSLGENEILMRVVTDGLCSSTLKAVKLGEGHKRVPSDIGEKPVIIGHEICGEIVKVGNKIAKNWSAGQKVVLQPNLKLENAHAPGYSYQFIGGEATYVIVSDDVISRDCLIPYETDSFFVGSLVESLSCVYRAYKAFYHTDKETLEITSGVKKGGRLAILGGAGPMGMAAVEFAKKCLDVSEIVVVDVSEERIDFAKRRGALTEAETDSCKVTYLYTAAGKSVKEKLVEMSLGGFDDVLVMSHKSELFILAQNICRRDGCINFFADPAQKDAYAQINLYKLHHNGMHIVGTDGSTPSDSRAVMKLIDDNVINPAIFVSHIVGLNECIEATMELEKNTGAKKICYTGIDIPYIAVEELEFWGESDPHYSALAEIVKRNGGLWCVEAEKYLLENAPRV